MKRLDDGSVTITKQESEILSELLVIARDLADQLVSDEHGSDLMEQKLLTSLNFLEDLGVSADELVGKLARRQEAK